MAFPKKYDAEGSFVKHYLPALRKFPAKYIYEPWKAPLNLQREAGCIIGCGPWMSHLVSALELHEYTFPCIDGDDSRIQLVCCAGIGDLRDVIRFRQR